MTTLAFISLLLVINILSFIGCFILDFILRGKWMSGKFAFKLFLICLAFGPIMLFVLTVLYVPMIVQANKKKQEK